MASLTMRCSRSYTKECISINGFDCLWGSLPVIKKAAEDLGPEKVIISGTDENLLLVFSSVSGMLNFYKYIASNDLL